VITTTFPRIFVILTILPRTSRTAQHVNYGTLAVASINRGSTRWNA
jgi:hypothetical protein